MNGIPHMTNMRSISEFGLSTVTMIFDDSSNNDVNRQKALEKMAQVSVPNNVQPTLGPDYSPVGQLVFYTLKSTNPTMDLTELKSLQDWVITKQLKSVPDVVDTNSFGGTTKEYQVAVDPAKLVSYGLNIAQVEQALTNNNLNGGGSFIEEGQQQINVRTIGLFSNVAEIGDTLIKTQNGTPIRIRDIATVREGAKIRLGQIGRAIHSKDGVISDDRDVVEGIVLLRKGADADKMLEALHQKIHDLNHGILASRCADRSLFGSEVIWSS